MPKSVRTTMNTRSKVFLMQNNALNFFDLVIKVVHTDFDQSFDDK